MGKQRRNRSKSGSSGATPYARMTDHAAPPMPSDLFTSTPSDLSNPTPSDLSAADASEPSTTEIPTRGSILQRHKLEYKKMRAECELMRKQSKKLSKKDLHLKQERKSIVKEAKDMMQELLDKQKAELEEYDRKYGTAASSIIGSEKQNKDQAKQDATDSQTQVIENDDNEDVNSMSD
eukprot:TRINITY_DN12509_c0_g1_i2.p1 TRINITY_DN12509_c0_g1~~TRINITY_DN12509_c0_g1_i2.p1  ORF type:complete len:178 (-),score=57.53 TRINITY_DN12509_c0_g1_i2:967-1500(-)